MATRGSKRYEIITHYKADIALNTLNKPKTGLIHHSDRGSQYASKAFRKLLKVHEINGSMSAKGDCWDNAVAESFFGSLRIETWASIN